MYNLMNSEPKQLWTTALRSDEFNQGRNTLTRVVANVEYDCCLGVLCKLYARSHDLDMDKFRQLNGSVRVYYGKEGATSYLPEEVAEWAGIERSAEYVLSDKNDADETFIDIADWIEENL